MRVFGFEITRTKQVVPSLSNIDQRGSWFPLIREAFSGAWQRNIVEDTTENILTFSAVYACVTLIASDIGKLKMRLMERDGDGIWSEAERSAFSPVLRKPNHFQTRIAFYQNWMTSKLIHGNTYVLKQRDERNVVTALYVLDPTRVRPMVAPNGDVFYQIAQDDLSRTDGVDLVIPAREIIHDVMVPLYHPLAGVSPITASGLAAIQGLRVQRHSNNFFQNGAQPGGLLTSPRPIQPEQAVKMQRDWDEQFGGENRGKVAVISGELTYQPLGMINAVDAQLIEQLRWTAENVCTAFRVPPYMIGVGPPPNYNNIEALTVQYYTQCLQNPIESIELLLDEGLGLPRELGTQFNLDDLMRMDTETRSKVSGEAIKSGNMAPNESRKRFWNLPPVAGGESPYLQQQNYSLAALAKRDALADPFATATVEPPAELPDPDEPPDAKQFRDVLELYRRDLDGASA